MRSNKDVICFTVLVVAIVAFSAATYLYFDSNDDRNAVDYYAPWDTLDDVDSNEVENTIMVGPMGEDSELNSESNQMFGSVWIGG